MPRSCPLYASCITSTRKTRAPPIHTDSFASKAFCFYTILSRWSETYWFSVFFLLVNFSEIKLSRGRPNGFSRKSNKKCRPQREINRERDRERARETERERERGALFSDLLGDFRRIKGKNWLQRKRLKL